MKIGTFDIGLFVKQKGGKGKVKGGWGVGEGGGLGKDVPIE